MILCFSLSMPNVGSWDGKWTAANRPYTRCKAVSPKKAEVILKKPYYSYNFGDGWRAGINVSQVDAKESRKIKRRSAGFCGYEWMIDSIIEHQEIKTNWNDKVPV